MSEDSQTSGQSASDLAAEALKAAQAAVASLKNDAGASANPPPAPPPSSAGEDALKAAQAAIAAARELNQPAASTSAPQAPAPTASAPPAHTIGGGAHAFNLPSFQAASPAAKPEGIDLLADVNLNVKIELGRTRMLVEDVLRLGEGSVVELDKLAGDPVDVYVNERHVARGEVLVLNDNFCVRINEIVAQVGDGKAR